MSLKLSRQLNLVILIETVDVAGIMTSLAHKKFYLAFSDKLVHEESCYIPQKTVDSVFMFCAFCGLNISLFDLGHIFNRIHCPYLL